MEEFFPEITGLGGRFDTVLALAKWGLLIIAAFVASYMLRTLAAMVKPTFIALGWLTGIQSGGSLAAGLLLGLRLFIGAALAAGAVVWFIKDWL